MNEENAIEIAKENPSVLKRPLLVIGDMTYVGFNEGVYKDVLG